MAIGITSYVAYDTSSWTDEQLEGGISGYDWYDKVVPESIAHTEELCLRRAREAGHPRVSVYEVTTILKGRMSDR